MDVLYLDRFPQPFRLSMEAPHGRHRRFRRWVDQLLRFLDVRPAGGGPALDGTAVDARNDLLVAYTAAEILLGLGLLAFVSVFVEIFPGIASPTLNGTALAGTAGGVLLWTMFGLMGSVRTLSSAEGSGHFTFHLSYVGAAMILGGPTAGAWVAFLSTIDRRELASQPWYGILANHASMVTAAVAGGTVYAVVHAGLLGWTGDPGLAIVGGVVVAGLVLELVANAFALATIRIRDELSWGGVIGILVDDFRRETILEVALIWVLVIAFGSMGWWAPLAVGVLVIWYLARSTHEDIDSLTGLFRKRTFLEKVDRKVGWIRRGILAGGAMLYIDLTDFHLVNNRHGHEVGDVVLRVVAQRMREVCPRREDILSRLMGDEFAVFLVGVTSDEVATRKAQQLVDALCAPVPTPVGPVSIGGAVGVVVATGSGVTPPSAMTLLLRAEQAMYLAKADPDPCGAWHLWSPDDPTPFAGDWIDRR